MPVARNRAVPILLLLLISLSSCDQGAADVPAATLEEGEEAPSDPASPPSRTPSPEPSAPEEPAASVSFNIPETVDAVYLQRVLQALYEIEGDAGRLIVEAGSVPDEAVEILRSIYDNQQLDNRIQVYEQQIAEGLEDTLRPPGNITVEVREVISADQDCVFFSGLRDYSAVVRSPRDRSAEIDYFQLLPLEEEQDFDDRNPTPWVIGGSVIRTDGNRPENPCAL